MKFLIDNQLPIRLGLLLRYKGHECAHVSDLRLDRALDREIWLEVERGSWVLISKDEDFLFLANQPDATGSLIWVRLGNCRNEHLVRAFGDALDTIVTSLQSGQRIIELR